MGNITQIKKDGAIINEYTYDSLGQLTCEEDAAAGVTYIYYYDKSGNITKKDKYPYYSGTFMGDYISYLSNSKETVATYTYGNATWGDMLTEYNGTAITYDEIGNPLNWRNISEMTWEGRELQAATVTAGPRAVYEYNSDGIRTKKTLASVVKYDYVLDGTKILSETVTHSSAGTSRTLYYLYDESGSVAGFIYNNQHYYFQKNLQGDVIRILNNYGAVVVEYTYDAWGKVLTTTGSLASTIGSYNPFRYRGYYYDSETGFYYLQSRYYDPTVGRFLNADGMIGTNSGIQGYNLFIYCGNNYVLYFDPSGFAPITNAERIGKALSKWHEMAQNHIWGAVHAAVQKHIVSKHPYISKEHLINGKRMDLYDEKTKEVWEIKHGALPAKGIAEAELSLQKYLYVFGNYPKPGAAGKFEGTMSMCDLGEKFDYYYNIEYDTPVAGVVLYKFSLTTRRKSAEKAAEKEGVYVYGRKSNEERIRSEVILPSPTFSPSPSFAPLIGIAFFTVGGLLKSYYR